MDRIVEPELMDDHGGRRRKTSPAQVRCKAVKASSSGPSKGDLSGPPYLPHPLCRLARLPGVVRASRSYSLKGTP